MQESASPLRHALSGTELWHSVRAGLWVVVLFAAGVLAAREYAAQIETALVDYAALGIGMFIASSAIAVLLPMLTNLPLVPAAVVAWGPAMTAALLLLGWMIGAALAFALGRHARSLTLKHFPSAQRHANIDRLIHPQHRLWSLILLRMTFPVDVLSYSLGLFSRSTSATENLLSTTLGAAPFAVLFALLPTLSTSTQSGIFIASTLAFVIYARWVWRGPDAAVE